MPRDKNIFTLNPTSLDMKRSVFNRNSQHKTSFNLGDIVPIYLDEILPGDTVSLDLAQVIRMSTPIAPVMDNIYADVYFFFVPNRIVWDHWQQFCGEADTQAWTQTSSLSVPTVYCNYSGATGVPVASLGDYFGLPVRIADKIPSITALGSTANSILVSELPLRAYYKIYNDWFRDENSIAPTLYTIGNSSNSSIHYYDYPKKASRFHDLFSSCLPAPQKGASVVLPLGTSAPVGYEITTRSANAMSSISHYELQAGNNVFTTGTKGGDFYLGSDVPYTPDEAGGSQVGANVKLYADLSSATAATINQIRMAFQVQKLLEKDARGGTRYIELLRAHFGVVSPDARLQRSEYLCGHRFRINVDQVVSTADSGASGSSVVGQTGAVSKTTQSGSMFTKSFVEHGMLLGFVVLRQDHTYSQGLDRFWLKKDRFDFYYPVLANIGEVPVYKSEINVYQNSAPAGSSGVFGYQEAWFDYRYKSSRCSSFMNPSTNNSLNYWTLGDVYTTTPSLNSNFLEETPTYLDRALQVQSSTMHQFIADFYFKAKYSRVMPLYSIPGLIDHH